MLYKTHTLYTGYSALYILFVNNDEFFVWLQKLMTQDISPVIDFYPVDFQTDLNGKQQEWEAVVLIPFIDEVGGSQG